MYWTSCLFIITKSLPLKMKVDKSFSLPTNMLSLYACN